MDHHIADTLEKARTIASRDPDYFENDQADDSCVHGFDVNTCPGRCG